MMDDTLPKIAALSRDGRAIQYNRTQYDTIQHSTIHRQHDGRYVAKDGGTQQRWKSNTTHKNAIQHNSVEHSTVQYIVNMMDDTLPKMKALSSAGRAIQ